MTERLQALLEARGLDVELLARLGVGACARLGAEWIAIPSVEAGAVVNTKYRTLGATKRFSQDKGGRQILWNVDCLADASLADEPLVITEGELDAMVALQCGFPRTVSVPGGAPMEALGEDAAAGGGSRKYACLDAAGPALDGVRQIILAADGDPPGANLLADLALRLGKARCRWLRYPPGCKDLNDVLLRHGERGVRELLRDAPWYPVPGIHRLSQLPPPDVSPALPIGVEGLDEHYRARRGDLVVVTGIPGHGKSSFVNEVCCRLAWRHGWNTCFASFEQMPQLDHRRALRSFHAGIAERDMTEEQIAAADAWIERRFSFMVAGEDEDVDLAWVLERAAAAVRRFEADILVIDPWNEMDHVRPPDMSLTEYTGFAIKQFKKFARKHRV
ncbi:MAG: toprim domain-containing protein, partial [Reyranellaceae bacterium]